MTIELYNKALVYAYVSECEGLLVQADGIFFQSEHVVGKDHDLVVSPLVEADQELTCTELVGIHGVEQNSLLRLYGHIFTIKLRRHGTPYLDAQRARGKRTVSLKHTKQQYTPLFTFSTNPFVLIHPPPPISLISYMD